MQIPFVGSTYGGRSLDFESSRAINYFVDTGSAEAKSQFALIGTPGTSIWLRIGNDPIRTAYKFGDYLFVIAGSTMYRVSADKTFTVVGELNTRTGRLLIQNNGIAARGVGGNQMLIIDETYGYIYDLLSNTIITHPSENFPVPAKAVAYMDGYFIVSSGNMGITVSELYDGLTFNGLAIAAAIATPDNIQSIINIHQQLFIIKEYSTEVWYNTGTATQDGCPFARVSGAVMDNGTMAPYSVARGNNCVYMLAAQRVGSGASSFIGVVELSGYTPTVITPPSLIYTMSKFNLEKAEAFCYSSEGHTFYQVTFPDDNITFVYDTTTRLWHERSTYTKYGQVTFDTAGKPTIDSSLPISQNRHLASSYVNFAGKHLVGDYRTGNLYELSTDYYTDNEEPIVSIRTTGVVAEKQDYNKVTTGKLTVDAEMGVGDQSVYSDPNDPGFFADGDHFADGNDFAGSAARNLSPGSNPEVFLSWSNDSGKTWSSEYPSSLGKTGEYKSRLIWRGLGITRNRVYRIKCSSPVKKVILGAAVEVSI